MNQLLNQRLPQLSLLFALLIGAPAPACAASNIDPQSTGNRYGWTENGGWLNMQGDLSTGVHVGATFLKDYAWHENFGWINFGDGSPHSGPTYSNTSAADFGVNKDAAGSLSGYAWGENIGWINFNIAPPPGTPVHVDPATGQFSGYAWGENIGWISFSTVSPEHVAQTYGPSAARNWTLY